MGVHNRITEDKFKQIKALAKEPQTDDLIAGRFSVSRSTVRNIRLSKDYQRYCERVFRFHGHPVGQKIAIYQPDVEKLNRDMEFEAFGEPDIKKARRYERILVFVIACLVVLVALAGILVGVMSRG